MKQAQFSFPSRADILSTLLSFTLIGALTGFLVGLFDAITLAHLEGYTILGTTGLNTAFGLLTGSLLGGLYGLLPSELGISQFLSKIQNWLIPKPYHSIYHRGQVITAIWLSTLALAFVAPFLAHKSAVWISNIQSPLFASLLLCLIWLTAFAILSVFIRSTTKAGARFFEIFISQIQHLSSSVQAVFHAFFVILCLYILWNLAGPATTQITNLIKQVHDPIYLGLSIIGISIVVFAFLFAFIRFLNTAQYEGLLAVLLKTVYLSRLLSHPLLHLSNALIFLLYFFVSWRFSEAPEWEIIAFKPALLTLVFISLLFMGGEYLKHQLQENAILMSLILILCMLIYGGFSSKTALSDHHAFKVLKEQSTASSFILSRLQFIIDRDGDGYSRYFGTLDCDDLQSNIYPGALEIAANKIDEDCNGIDLPKENKKEVLVTNVQPLPENKITTNTEPNLADIQLPILSDVLFNRLNKAPYHIVLISISRLNGKTIAQNLDTYFPNLVKLEHTTRFSKVYLPSALNSINTMSLITGRFPTELTRDQKAQTSYATSGNHLISETLKTKKYQTLALTTGNLIDDKYGFNQGFDQWYRSDRKTFEDLSTKGRNGIKNLKLNKDERFFVWLHTDELSADWDGVSNDRSKYLKSVQNLDRQIAKLIIDLSATYQNQVAVFVVGTDAGGSNSEIKELKENSITTIAFSYLPEGKNQEINKTLSLNKIAPSILDLAKIELNDPKRERMSLKLNGFVEYLLGDPNKDELCYVEGLGNDMNSEKYALIYGQSKKITQKDTQQINAFNLKNDPTEIKINIDINQKEIELLKLYSDKLMNTLNIHSRKSLPNVNR